MRRETSVRYYLALSVVAGIFVLVMVFLGSSGLGEVTFGTRAAVGGVYTASCLLGISIAIRPGWLRRVTNQTGHGPSTATADGRRRRRQGHHPDCEHFKGHTLQIGGKVLCGGCTGLALGSVVSIVGAASYMILSLNESRIVLFSILGAGLFVVSLCLVETRIPAREKSVHLLSNAFLVVGFLLVVTGVLELTAEMVFGLVAVLLSFLWLDTRIQISGWRHFEICKECTETCKASWVRASSSPSLRRG